MNDRSRAAACRATATTCTSRPSARPTRRWSCSVTAPAATTAIWFQQVPGVRARLPRRHVGPTRLRPLDEPPRAREPAHRDGRPARDPRSPRASSARTSSGQSMGGWAAMGLAVAHGDRVRSLVLADTLGGIPIDGWWKRGRDSRRATGRSIIPRSRTTSASATRSARTSTCRSAGSVAIRSPIRRRCCARWAT